MRQAVLSITMFLFLAIFLVGCGERNPHEDTMNEIISKLNDAYGKYAALKTKIESAMKNKEKGEKLKTKDLKEAINAAKELSKLSQPFADLRVKAESIKKLSPEEQTKLLQKFEGQLNDNINQLNKAEDELAVVLQEAKLRTESSAMEVLEDEIRKAKENLAVLTRQL